MEKSYDTLSWSEFLLMAIVFAVIFGAPFLVNRFTSEDVEKGPAYVATGKGLRVECVDRHKFVVYSGGFGGGVSQMLTLDEKGNLQPAMCAKNSTP